MEDILDIYPFNLITAILGSKEEAVKVYLPGFKRALNTLSEREKEVLRARFKDKLTLDNCGKLYGITGSRVKTIVDKAIRKIRNPVVMKMYMGASPSAVGMLSRKCKILQEEINSLNSEIQKCKYENNNTEKHIIRMKTPIEGLELSTRSYRALRRAGKMTLEDVSNMTKEELRSIRNMGVKSQEEVLLTLKKYGIYLRDTLDEYEIHRKEGFKYC